MTTSHSEPPEGERGELIPALTPEVMERDPSLIALVRNMIALDYRLSQMPRPPLSEADAEEAQALAELDQLELQLRRYAEEMAVNKKVDGYTSMIAYLERQRDALDAEARRLADRKKKAQSQINRMLGAAHYAMHLLRIRELEGLYSSLALVKNPGRVHVIDQVVVPPEWRQAQVRLNLRLWQEILGALPPEFRERVQRQSVVTDDVILSALAPVLKAKTEVPGVEWVQDDRVQRR